MHVKYLQDVLEERILELTAFVVNLVHQRSVGKHPVVDELLHDFGSGEAI